MLKTNKILQHNSLLITRG